MKVVHHCSTYFIVGSLNKRHTRAMRDFYHVEILKIRKININILPPNRQSLTLCTVSG